MFNVYKPSGSVGVLTFPLILGGVIAAIGLAYLYQLLLEWIPLIYINFLITGAMGVALGMVAGWIVTKGHNRNPWVGGLIGIIIGTSGLAAGYWFQYQTQKSNYANMMVEENPQELDQMASEILEENDLPETSRQDVKQQIVQNFLDQFTFSEYIKDRADVGWMVGRQGNLELSGVFVYLIWLIEAGLIYFYAVRSPYRKASAPYSENLSTWASEWQVVMVLPITDDQMVAKIKSAKTVDELLDIPVPKSLESNVHAMYTISSIPGEEMEDAFLSVTLVTTSVNKKGEEENKEEPLVKHAILTTEKREQLVENASLLQEAMTDYHASLQASAEAGPEEE